MVPANVIEDKARREESTQFSEVNTPIGRPGLAARQAECAGVRREARRVKTTASPYESCALTAILIAGVVRRQTELGDDGRGRLSRALVAMAH